MLLPMGRRLWGGGIVLDGEYAAVHPSVEGENTKMLALFARLKSQQHAVYDKAVLPLIYGLEFKGSSLNFPSEAAAGCSRPVGFERKYQGRGGFGASPLRGSISRDRWGGVAV